MSTARYLQYLSGVVLFFVLLYALPLALLSVTPDVALFARPDAVPAWKTYPVSMAPGVDLDAAKALSQQPVAPVNLGTHCLYIIGSTPYPVPKTDLGLARSAPCP